MKSKIKRKNKRKFNKQALVAFYVDQDWKDSFSEYSRRMCRAMSEQITFFLNEYIREHNIDLPEITQKGETLTRDTFCARIPVSMVSELEKDAKENYRTVTGHIRYILKRYITENIV